MFDHMNELLLPSRNFFLIIPKHSERLVPEETSVRSDSECLENNNSV